MLDEDLKNLKWYQTQGIKEVILDDKTKVDNNPGQRDMSESMFVEDSIEDPVKDIKSLKELRESVEKFDKCLLKKMSTNTVFSDGTEADVMLIGEAPGANEDIQGIPFCGESGKLLDQIFSSIGLSREKNLYITNSVFWRPPGNRKPSDEEIKQCLPFLEKHISLIKPKLIVAVGAISLYALFGYTGSISKKRKQVLEYKNKYLEKPINAITIFHPAYLLRQPSQKKTAWEDMLLIKKLIS